MNLKAIKYRYLIQQYKSNIFSYSIYLLKNRMDAEDITQEVMIRIWEKMEQFKMKSAKSYIMKVTHNLCIDHLRKRSSSSKKEFSFDEEFVDEQTNSTPAGNPEELTHNKIMSDNIKSYIKKLPENLRSVFVLYEIEGMKYKEISAALEIPLNSVKVYLLRARKQLQENLKTYKPEEVL